MIKQAISGVLLLNKPLGLSSNTALQKVKRVYNALKAGHTGTLDPLATGLLPICFGEATKFSSFLLDADKEYVATIKLGAVTTTYDSEGDITATSPVLQNIDEINQCVNTFLGEIIQYPPIYSALKVDGRKLYDYARSGEEVIIKPRNVTIHELEILSVIDTTTFTLRVLCSKGTYIRSLAHDIGQKLGCGAYLAGLIRTKTNNFVLEQSVTLDELISLSEIERICRLLPTDIVAKHLVELQLSAAQFDKIKNGHSFIREQISTQESALRLYYNDIFLGLATDFNGVVTPLRLCDTSKYN